MTPSLLALLGYTTWMLLLVGIILFIRVPLTLTGKRAANNTNTLWADGYTTLDLGTRLKTKAFGKPLTWRLGINNVTDEHYWASLMPGGTDGDTVAGARAYMGEPSTFKTTLQLDF